MRTWLSVWLTKFERKLTHQCFCPVLSRCWKNRRTVNAAFSTTGNGRKRCITLPGLASTVSQSTFSPQCDCYTQQLTGFISPVCQADRPFTHFCSTTITQAGPQRNKVNIFLMTAYFTQNYPIIRSSSSTYQRQYLPFPGYYNQDLAQIYCKTGFC